MICQVNCMLFCIPYYYAHLKMNYVDSDSKQSNNCRNEAWFGINCFAVSYQHSILGCVTGYQVIRVIRIFAKTYPFE